MSEAVSSIDSARAPNVRLIFIVGLGIIFLFFGILGGWAALAPLSRGAVAAGTVKIEGHRKTVQHLEGGIVADIKVREGDVVAAGQTLITLDQTRPKASLEVLKGQLLAFRALEARLIAERDLHDQVSFPKELLVQTSFDTQKAIEGQRGIFQARLESLNSQSGILNQRIAQYREEIRGMRAEMKAQDTQLELMNEEVIAAEKLFEKGLLRKPRLLELKRRNVEIEGARAKNQANVARVEQNITESRMQIIDLSRSRQSEVVQELREVQVRIADVIERVAAAQDVLNRTLVIAPTSGSIVNLNVHATGAVVGPGEPIMEVVPNDEKLIIEARVRPTDIDVVYVGLNAQIRLSAFNQRTTPVLNGQIEQVSADIFTDDRSGESYYKARVILKPEVEIPDSIQLYPGMPVDVLIVTGEWTALEYIMQPLKESIARSMREE